MSEHKESYSSDAKKRGNGRAKTLEKIEKKRIINLEYKYMPGIKKIRTRKPKVLSYTRGPK